MTDDEGVSPVIGVMLMIVVTIIIAAVVSAFAGGLGSEKKTGPTVALSSQILYSAKGTVAEHPQWTVNVQKSDGSTCSFDTIVGGSSAGATGNPFLFKYWGANRGGVIFTHQGGDPIDLRNLRMDVGSADLNIVVDYGNTKTITGGQCVSPPSIGATVVGSDFYRGSTCSGTVTGITATDGSGADFAATAVSKYFYKIGPGGLDTKDTIIRPGDSFVFLVDNNAYQTRSQTDASRAMYWCFATCDKFGNYRSMNIERGTDGRWSLYDAPSGEVLAKGNLEFPNS